MIVEGRTITNVAIERTYADPSTIRLHIPQDMRVDEITLADGRKVYDVLTSPAA